MILGLWHVSFTVSDLDRSVADLCTLKPLDLRTVLGSVRKTSRAVIIHEAPAVLRVWSRTRRHYSRNAVWRTRRSGHPGHSTRRADPLKSTAGTKRAASDRVSSHDRLVPHGSPALTFVAHPSRAGRSVVTIVLSFRDLI